MMAGLLFVLFDDVSPEDLDLAHTPNLDTIASMSDVYTYHHGEAACSLSRATLISGQHAYQHKVGGVLKEDWFPRFEGAQLLPWLVPGGSAYIGKYHLTSTAFPRHAIEVSDFGMFKGTIGNFQEENYFQFTEYDSVADAWFQVDTYATQHYCDIARTEVQHDTGLVFLALHTAHRPLHWPPQGTYTNSEDRRLAMIEAADYYLGGVLAAAVDNNYRIVVTSDNAGQWKTGGKGNLAESALNVPLYIHTPGQSQSTQIDDMTDWNSVRVWIYTGYMSKPEVLNHDRFKGAGEIDYTTYEQSIQNTAYKLIIESDGSKRLFDLADEETEIWDTRITEYLYSKRLIHD